MDTKVFNFDTFDSLLLTESLALARKKYLDSGKIAETDFNDIKSVDHYKNHKALPKMIEFFLAGTSAEDLGNVVNSFFTFADGGYIEQKDINQYKTFKELANVVKIASEKQQQKKTTEAGMKAEYTALIDSGEADLIHNDANITIIRQHSYDACKMFGKGSKWCITMADDVSHYKRHFMQNKETFYFIDIRGAEMRKKLMLDITYRISPAGDKIKIFTPKAWDPSIITKIDTKLRDNKNPFKMYFVTEDGRRFVLKNRSRMDSEHWIMDLAENVPTDYVEKKPAGHGKILDTSLYKLAVQVDPGGQLMGIWDGADYSHPAKSFLEQI